MDTSDKKDLRPGNSFDPDGVANTSNNIFGLPFSLQESKLVFIPVPWDVTTSNYSGTSEGPSVILKTSYQIDLYDPVAPNAWKQGLVMEQIDHALMSKNNELRKHSERIISFLEAGGDTKDNSEIRTLTGRINQECDLLSIDTEKKCLQYLENGQIPFIVGGEHSVSDGAIQAFSRQGKDFGILQVDAHADMRDQYMGFTHSHASVMRRALDKKGVSGIVQVGIREICSEEARFISMNHRKIKTYFDHDLKQRAFEGETWREICRDIADKLPEFIYVSFDVDGLVPSDCPGTGTPVPGGLTYSQAVYLIETIVSSGRRIIGGDLVETGPTNMDGIISSRLLYRMAGMAIKSNEKA